MRAVVVASALLAFAAGCSSAIYSRAYQEPCAGHTCRVAVANHSSADVSVRYADSTGRHELIGLIPAGETRAFNVQFIHSAGIRVFVSSKEYGLYAADVTIDRVLPQTDVHYPDDFQPASDTLMLVRARR